MIDKNNADDRGRQILRILAVVLAVVMVISAVFYVLGEWERKTGIYTDESPVQTDTVEFDGKSYVIKDDIEIVPYLL